MNVLQGLQPAAVFTVFEELSRIPHGSGNTAGAADYVAAFADRHGLRAVQDEWHNVIVYKPGSPGREAEPPVILQAHLDMVCAKQPDVTFDFTRDALRLQTDGEWVWAQGTTLGGDDGAGVAIILAVLARQDLSHPPIEAVFTSDEETGMYGAAGLDFSRLQGRRLINLDSEEEGIFTVGCAGGVRCTVTLPMAAEACNAPAYTVAVRDLQGGHSGAEIHRNRQNANRLLAQTVAALGEGVRLASFAGGKLDNAIPREASCLVCTHLPAETLAAAARQAQQTARAGEDTAACVTVTPAPTPAAAWTAADTARLLTFITTAPAGVQAMCADLPDVVETSLNMGVVACDAAGVQVHFALRSSVESAKAALLERVLQTARACGGQGTAAGAYPAWEYRAHSPLRDALVNTYTAQYGKAPQVIVIHAGLECGLFCQKCPGLDAVSIGPALEHIHTPAERMNVASVGRSYEFVCRCLAAL